mmetsp:Transcript_19346/g.56214  ORF Transcript_19346/g.56214 Transcript_19346/m.56214 type:complete len:451 (-) Transcript_19346:39-1391(-)
MPDEGRIRGRVVVLLWRLHELRRLLRLPNSLLAEGVHDAYLPFATGPQAVGVPLAPRVRLRLVAITERRGEHGLRARHACRIREGHADVTKQLPIGLGGLVGAADGEVDDGEALALEILNGVAAATVEQEEVFCEVDRQLVLVLERVQRGLRLVVLGPIVQATARELPKRADHRWALVVAVTVQLRRVALVDVDRGEHEAVGELGGQMILQPPANELRHRWVEARGPVDADGAVVARQQAEGVAVDPLHALAHHVLPCDILPEAPEAEHVEHIGIGHRLALRVRRLQDQLRHHLGLYPGGVQLHAEASLLVGGQVAAIDAQAIRDLERLGPLDPLVVHPGQHLVGLRPSVVPCRLVGVNQPAPLRASGRAEVAMLEIEQQVEVVGAEPEGLTNRLRLAVFRIADEGLGLLLLGIGRVLDRGIVQPRQHLQIRLPRIGARHGCVARLKVAR